jgi:hypothetical protein
MTNISVEGDKLVIEVQGWHKLWSLMSRLEIPLDHVSGVRSAADERASGIRAPGTYIPGIITAGTFHHDGKKVFWDVHDPAKAIAIDLHDDCYSTLIIEVSDPQSAISNIESALFHAHYRIQ